MKSWQFRDARARLGEVIRQATDDGPQHITVGGVPACVVLSERDYRRLHASRPRFVTFMRDSPLVGMDLDIEREQTLTRDIGPS